MPAAPRLFGKARSAAAPPAASRAAAAARETRDCPTRRKVAASPANRLHGRSASHNSRPFQPQLVLERHRFSPADQPSAIPALPPGTASPPEGAASPVERPEPGGPHAIPRRHAPIEQLVRQGSFRGFPALSQKNSPFKRQLSLRLNDLPSTLQRKTADFQAKNAGKLRAHARPLGFLHVLPKAFENDS